MKVEYKKVSGKNFGLHFEDAPRSVRDAVVLFINRNNPYLDAPHHKECKSAAPFIQSDGLRNDERATHGYLFIEFWSIPEDHRTFSELLLGEVRKIRGFKNLQLTSEVTEA